MTASGAPTGVPTARQLRVRLRRGRREHNRHHLGDALTDLYIVVLFLVMYGTAAVATLAGQVQTPGAGPHAVQTRIWLLAALLVATVGATWQGLRALGPLLATPAGLAWCAATPVDRRGWLLPRFAGLLVAGAGTGAAVGGVAAVVAAPAGQGPTAGVIGAACLLGAAGGTLLCALAILGQAAPPERAWPTWGARGLLLLGVAGSMAVIVLDRVGLTLPQASTGSQAVAVALPAVALGLAAGATGAAGTRLPRLSRALLSVGAGLAAAAATAVIWMDLSLVASVLENRRWRRVGRVASRPLRAGHRIWVLVQAEIRRVARRPGALGAYGLALILPYAAGVFSPTAAELARIVAGYLAVSRLASGLRIISGSPALRRSLGGSDLALRLAHLVVPAVGLALWWLLATPAAPTGPWLVAVLPLAVLLAVYRAATRPPLRYGGALVDTPFGLLPIDMVRQLMRGPDVLGLALVAELIL